MYGCEVWKLVKITKRKQKLWDVDPEKDDVDTVEYETDIRKGDGDSGGPERVDMCGLEKAVETPGLYARALLSRKGCISRKDRGKKNTLKIEDQTCCKSEGGHPERDDGG